MQLLGAMQDLDVSASAASDGHGRFGGFHISNVASVHRLVKGSKNRKQSSDWPIILASGSKTVWGYFGW